MEETFKFDPEAKWITNGEYNFTQKKVSPSPMFFRKKFNCKKDVLAAKIYATALGIYELKINDTVVGNDYFTPGFTSYKTRLQYQEYDITSLLGTENELFVTVTGGWAVGSFIYTRVNRVSADRQALLVQMQIDYKDGTKEIIYSDETFETSMDGKLKEADLYDGEIYDASFKIERNVWKKAVQEKLRIKPNLIKTQTSFVKKHEIMKPISVNELKDGCVYDFGQNFAGVVNLKINGRLGQKITVYHAEILNRDGSLNTKFLRTAKARIEYTCKEGLQEYSPKFTYMGFRYVYIEGISKDDIEVQAFALYSDINKNGEFSCSSKELNRLQSNIVWSAKSNFVEIPTDCPQRDERMGWTGDIAVFAATGCFNFDLSSFLEKWLADMRAEQLKTGGFPNTIPACGFGFPTTMPSMAIEFWGDACILVPWALYMSKGDKKVLEDNYEMIKKYVDACTFWAHLLSVGEHRYIWNTPSIFHFGDWVAPDVPKMSQWQKRSKYTATASLANTSELLSKIAGILGKKEDVQKYSKISKATKKAFVSVFTDGNGKLKEEFQTAYVLLLYFNMVEGKAKENAVNNLVKLIEKNNYCIGTGFPGTPYILFALADNGRADVAFKMLMNDKCPSWLYEVKQGATTIWERWDGLDENGECPISDDGTDMMISYNHYASGAVGDFLYKRIAGIEAKTAGYKEFKIAPLTGPLSSAKGEVNSPYGKIVSDWHIENGKFYINLTVPENTSCELILPDGSVEILNNGEYTRSCNQG